MNEIKLRVGKIFMFKRKKMLTKEYMTKKYYVSNQQEICLNKQNFINYLNKIEEEFYNHDFKRDDRYVCVYYTKEQCKNLHLDECPTKWCLGSLIEMICNPNQLTVADYQSLIGKNNTYLNKDINECRQIYESYNKDNIISLNERDYILHALNMIKDSLDKCDDNLEWK